MPIIGDISEIDLLKNQLCAVQKQVCLKLVRVMNTSNINSFLDVTKVILYERQIKIVKDKSRQVGVFDLNSW
jgi:hypothetical protein